jgi:hypothetical protein
MRSSPISEVPASLLSCTRSAPLISITQAALFQVAPDSECSDLLSTTSQLASFAPEILASIELDLDTHALDKKRKRWEHQRWIEDQSGPLIDLPQADMSKLQLAEGRPRMHPLAVLAFLLLRGWLGGGKDKRFELILRESISLHVFLQNVGQPLPGISTIEENLNALSNETRESILKVELALALNEELDDFKDLRIDSTHCASASAYPTDSGTLTKLMCRLCQKLQNLKRIELPALPQSQSEHFEDSVKQMRQLNYRICTLTSSSAIQAEEAERREQQGLAGRKTGGKVEKAPEKPGTNGSKESAKMKLRRELYEELYAKCVAMLAMLVPIFAMLKKQTEEQSCSPQMQEKRRAWTASVEEDLQATGTVIEQSRRRVCEGKRPSAKSQMPLSVSDSSGRFIKKGGWEQVFGYRAQCGFSAAGMVAALIVPIGNQADQSQLSCVVNQAIANTGVIPELVTVDDGYTGESEMLKVKEAGVEIVSFSGARGRALLGEEKWAAEQYVQARRDRNGAESGIFVLKNKVRFGQLSRTGIDAVQAEQLEKVLSANALKIVELRKSKYKREQQASWAQGLPGKGKREVA